tara:strand:- start:354 stop:2279 length:1926 start_codon:yes stop_codon:yes gene_type:complete
MKKYFEILLISEDAKWEDVENAYNELLEIYDPSLNEDVEGFAEEFEKVKDAYQKLKKHFNIEDKEVTKKPVINVQGAKFTKAIPKNENTSKISETKKKTVSKNEIETKKKVEKKKPKTKTTAAKKEETLEEIFDSYKKKDSSEKVEIIKKLIKLKQVNVKYTILIKIICKYEKVKDENELLKFLENKPKKNLPKRKIKKEYVILSAVFIIAVLFVGLISYENYKLEKAAELFENAKYSLSKMRLTTAESEINEALSYNNRNVDYYLLKGKILFEFDDYSEARGSFIRAKNINSKIDSINFKIAETYYKESNFSSLEISLDNFVENRRLKGNIYQELNKIDLGWKKPSINNYLAIAYSNKIIKNEGSFSSYEVNFAKIEKSKANLFNRNYQEAIDQINSFIYTLNETQMSTAYNLRGISYSSLNNEKKAIEDYGNAIGLRESRVFYSNRADSYYYLDEFSKAYLDYKKSIELGSKPEDFVNVEFYEKSKEEYERIRYANSKRGRYNRLRVGQYYKGGIIYNLSYNYKVKIIATTTSSQQKTYYEAWRMCDDLSLNGYSDWRLPSSDDFRDIVDQRININSGLRNVRIFSREIKYDSYYWTSDYSTKEEKRIAYRSIKKEGSYWSRLWSNKNYVRAVREHTFR